MEDYTNKLNSQMKKQAIDKPDQNDDDDELDKDREDK